MFASWRFARAGERFQGDMHSTFLRKRWGAGRDGCTAIRGNASFMDINGYLNEIRNLAATGRATEHSYRPALERLFKSIGDDMTVINEPKRLTDVGAPDFVFDKNGVSIGWCEAKDLFKEITKFKFGDYLWRAAFARLPADLCAVPENRFSAYSLSGQSRSIRAQQRNGRKLAPPASDGGYRHWHNALSVQRRQSRWGRRCGGEASIFRKYSLSPCGRGGSRASGGR